MEFTDKDYTQIENMAHRLFIESPVGPVPSYGLPLAQHFVAMCYTTAVISFLKSKGLINETSKADEKKD
jgi:hypothetical protein